MKKKLKGWFITVLMITVFSSNRAIAQEVQQVETNGSIGFTGVYEPIGTPDPTPPETIVRPPITEVAKPGGLLPQTNDTTSYWALCLGLAILIFFFLLFKLKTNKYNTKKNKKAGIIT